MQPNVSALERAFELARSGQYSSVDDVKRGLSSEGYSTAQITGRGLSRQLLALIRDAQASATSPDASAPSDGSAPS